MSTPSERSLFRKAAAHASWANTNDRSARTANARAAMDQKFLDQAGGDPEKAAHLRTAYYASLAAKSAQTRRKAKEVREEAAKVERELAYAGVEPEPEPSIGRSGEVGLAERIARAIEAEGLSATPSTRRIIAMCAAVARRVAAETHWEVDYDRLAAALRVIEERNARLRTSALDGRRRGTGDPRLPRRQGGEQ